MAECKNEFRFWKKEKSRPWKQRTGRSNGKREGSQEKNTEGCGMSSKREGSCHRRAVERRQREMMLREVHCPRKKETFVREYKAMHEETFLSSGLRKHRRKKQGHGQIGQRRKAEVVKERRREKRRQRWSKEGV